MALRAGGLQHELMGLGRGWGPSQMVARQDLLKAAGTLGGSCSVSRVFLLSPCAPHAVKVPL